MQIGPDQCVSKGIGDRLGAAVHAELDEDSLNMGCHGLAADVELLGDRLLAQSPSQKLQHLLLTRGQFRRASANCGLRGRARTDEEALDACEQLVAKTWLHD